MSSVKKPKACAYVLIDTEIDKAPDVVKELRGKTYITEAREVYGVFDAVARIEVEADSPSIALEQLKDIVANEMRLTPGIKRVTAVKVAGDENGYLGFIKNEKGDFVHRNLGSKF